MLLLHPLPTCLPNMQKIDLHGVKHENVPRLIEKAITSRDFPVEVITGKSVQMKKIVAKTAKQYNLHVRDHINNPGRVIIYEAQ